MPGSRFAPSRRRFRSISRPSIVSLSAVACVLLTLLPPASAWAVPPLTDFTRRVGNYYWEDPFESATATRRPDEAMRTIVALGGHAARVLFTPPGFSCDTLGQPRLDQWRAQPGLQAALDNPDIATYELTIVGCNSTGTPYFAANGPAVSEVYKNFALDLYRTYAGTGKRFILSNWEGDNAVHCCSTYLYARNSRIAPDPATGNRYDACGGIMPVDTSDPQGRSQPYRAYCDGLFSASYGYPNADAALDGFALWLQARQQGVNDGRAQALAEGRSGVEVLHAPEINVVNQLENPTFEDGRPLTDWSGALVRFHSLVQDKLPVMSPRFDMVSYSSYETMSQPAGTIRNQVCLDFGTIRSKLGLSSPAQLVAARRATADPAARPPASCSRRGSSAAPPIPATRVTRRRSAAAAPPPARRTASSPTAAAAPAAAARMGSARPRRRTSTPSSTAPPARRRSTRPAS